MEAIGMAAMFTGAMIFGMSFVMFMTLVHMENDDKKELNRIIKPMKFIVRAIGIVVFAIGLLVYLFL